MRRRLDQGGAGGDRETWMGNLIDPGDGRRWEMEKRVKEKEVPG